MRDPKIKYRKFLNLNNLEKLKTTNIEIKGNNWIK